MRVLRPKSAWFDVRVTGIARRKPVSRRESRQRLVESLALASRLRLMGQVSASPVSDDARGLKHGYPLTFGLAACRTCEIATCSNAIKVVLERY